MCRVRGAIFAIAFTLLIGADAKKAKKKSELMVLVQLQEGWKKLWKDATMDITKKCKASCNWERYYEMERKLQSVSNKLITKSPEYKSTLGAMMQMSKRATDPEAHNANCRPSQVHGRDDFCICARDHKDWQTDCDYALDTHKCRGFLGTVCNISFTEEEEDIGELSESENVGQRMKDQLASKKQEEEARREAEEDHSRTKIQNDIKKLQRVIDSLDKEHEHLVGSQQKHGNSTEWKPLLANLDRRIKSQKDKALKHMQDLIAFREVELAEQSKAKDL